MRLSLPPPGKVSTSIVAWHIADGPEDAPWEGVDARGWRYTLESDGAQRSIVVEVSGPALTALERGPEGVAEITRLAVETEGRSEVEKVLDEAEPPRRISLGGDGYVVRAN